MQPELAKILAVHGGLDYWRSLQRLEIEMSVDGFLFKAKRLPALRHVHLSLSTERPEVTLHDYPRAGQSTQVFGDQRVEIRAASGELLSSRDDPRAMFNSLRRFFYWDALDFAYFCAYAMWNYLSMPYLFAKPGVSVEVSVGGAIGATRLTLHFPPDLPTHCACQDFYFDADGHLLRHDYTAEVVGHWARAVHLSEAYGRFGGLQLPTRRRVYPKLFNRPLRLLTLVAIDLHKVTPMPA